MDMTRATIIGGSIADNLWPEVALAMVHVKNIKPISTLDDKNPHNSLKMRFPL